MMWPRKTSVVHGAGAMLLGSVLSCGYVFGYQPWAEALDRTPGLHADLAGYEALIEELSPKSELPAGKTDSEPDSSDRATPQGTSLPMTPTVFLSTFESQAREIGLLIESSKELEPGVENVSPAVEPGSAGTPLLIEVTGTGTFAGLVQLCKQLNKPLPGLEILRMRVQRGQGDAVRWTLVCMNHDDQFEQE